MAKKFGKILLFTAAIGTAAAAAYYYMQKKDSVVDVPEDDDYDDFSEDLDSDTESSRNYVSLNTETKPEGNKSPDEENVSEEEKVSEEEISSEAESISEEKKESEAQDTFTPLTEQVKIAEEKAAETIDEFFDENDSAEKDTPADNQ